MNEKMNDKKNSASQMINNNNISDIYTLKVIYPPSNSMNKFVTNKSKLPQDGFLIWGDLLLCDPLRGSHDSQSPHIRA